MSYLINEDILMFYHYLIHNLIVLIMNTVELKKKKKKGKTENKLASCGEVHRSHDTIIISLFTRDNSLVSASLLTSSASSG